MTTTTTDTWTPDNLDRLTLAEDGLTTQQEDSLRAYMLGALSTLVTAEQWDLCLEHGVDFVKGNLK